MNKIATNTLLPRIARVIVMGSLVVLTVWQIRGARAAQPIGEAINDAADAQPQSPGAGIDWPQVQRTPQRTGYTTETLGTNFHVVWTHPFQPEKVYPQVQAIVYSGQVFVGTEMGNLYALNATTGEQAWVFHAGGPILSSVAAADDKVFVGAMDGAVYAVNASSGAQIWKSSRSWRHGFSTAPVVAESKVMLGGRDGVFYALDMNDGHVVWQYPVGAPILQTAAWDNGRVFFGAMDMYFYALNTTDGSFAWKQKTNAMAFKDYWPVVTGGKVLVRPMAMQGEQKNFYAFDEGTGNQTINLPQFDGQTMNGATTPPCVDRDGYLVVPAPAPNTAYGSGWGRLSLSNPTIVESLVDANSPNAGFGNEDETLNATCANNMILSMHTEESNANYTGAFDLNSWRWIHIGPGWTNEGMSTNTQGGGGNPASISNGMVYHISYHELIARATQ
jgi:hypothetical protein